VLNYIEFTDFWAVIHRTEARVRPGRRGRWLLEDSERTVYGQ